MEAKKQAAQLSFGSTFGKHKVSSTTQIKKATTPKGGK